jgi:hypothetical protein
LISKMEENEDWTALNKDLGQQYGLILKESASLSDLEESLALRINTMIQSDFTSLIRILYRVDVDEARLRHLLAENRTNPGQVIARLIIDRQLQKIKSRRVFRSNPPASDEEKW